jgi:hypothetical protein
MEEIKVYSKMFAMVHPNLDNKTWGITFSKIPMQYVLPVPTPNRFSSKETAMEYLSTLQVFEKGQNLNIDPRRVRICWIQQELPTITKIEEPFKLDRRSI